MLQAFPFRLIHFCSLLEYTNILKYVQENGNKKHFVNKQFFLANCKQFNTNCKNIRYNLLYLMLCVAVVTGYQLSCYLFVCSDEF